MLWKSIKFFSPLDLIATLQCDMLCLPSKYLLRIRAKAFCVGSPLVHWASMPTEENILFFSRSSYPIGTDTATFSTSLSLTLSFRFFCTWSCHLKPCCSICFCFSLRLHLFICLMRRALCRLMRNEIKIDTHKWIKYSSAPSHALLWSVSCFVYRLVCAYRISAIHSLQMTQRDSVYDLVWNKNEKKRQKWKIQLTNSASA